jgi:hypothetical protein
LIQTSRKRDELALGATDIQGSHQEGDPDTFTHARDRGRTDAAPTLLSLI